MVDALSVLREHGIQATPQRIAVMEYVLQTVSHPTADEVWQKVRRSCPTVSRATVYNTLNRLVEEGLLRTQVLKEGTVVFDCCMAPHHHFIDQATGRIYDVPWGAVRVTGHRSLDDFEVEEYQVVMRGRRKKR
jgi:Fe2+ or Zn2+ uptake regulation protein